MRENAKKIFFIISAILLIVAFVYFMLVEPIMNLTNKKDLHTINADSAFEILEIEHSINGLIPIGKDYYYVAVAKGTQDAYIIRAPKKWFNNYFNTDYTSKDANGFNFTALSERIDDYEVRDELVNRVSQVQGLNYPLGTDYCLEFSYKIIAIKKLALFVYAILLAIAGILISKKKETINDNASKIFLIAFVVFLVLTIMTIK